MLRLYRAAKLLSSNAERIGPRTYEIDPGDVVFLRDAVERAGVIVEKERTAE